MSAKAALAQAPESIRFDTGSHPDSCGALRTLEVIGEIEARATAGLPLRRACIAVPDDDPQALAAGARLLLDDERATTELREEARRYLATHHSAEAYQIGMRALLREAAPSPAATHSEPRRRAAQVRQAQ